LIDKFEHKLASVVHHVGSRVTCNPAPENTDDDYLVFVWDFNFDEFVKQMDSDGWKIGGSRIEHCDAANVFQSWTKPGSNINVISTMNTDFCAKFMLATQLATRFNLLAKTDRISLFQAILYGKAG
jgi:hypothetical protein